MDTRKRISELNEEIKEYYEKISLLNDEVEKLKKKRLLPYEKKYYFNNNYDGGTLIYIDKFDDDKHGFFYAEGYFLTMAISTGYYDDENYFRFVFSDNKMYHFVGCRSYDEVYKEVFENFKELSKEEFFEKIEEYNQIYLKQVKKYAK